MKIGIISTTQKLPWAATDEIWFRLAVLAAKKGHSISVVADKALELGGRIPTELKTSICVYSRRTPFRPTRLFLAFEKLLSSFSCLQKNKVDIIIINGGSIFDAFNQPEIFQFTKKCRIPLVFYCHGHSEFYQVPARKALRDFLTRMKALIFVSDENLRTIEMQLATSFSNAYVVRNTPSFTLNEPLAWPANKIPQLAMVARLDSYWKGHEVLFRILAEKPWKNREWILRCYGEGRDKPFLEELIEHLGLKDRILLCSHIQDIRNVWANSQILLLPTKAESFSLAMLESMMCGRPVVTTNVGDHSLVVKNAETGWISDVGTPSSFAAALESAWIVRESWEQIGINAFQMVNTLKVRQGSEGLLDLVFEIMRK